MSFITYINFPELHAFKDSMAASRYLSLALQAGLVFFCFWLPMVSYAEAENTQEPVVSATEASTKQVPKKKTPTLTMEQLQKVLEEQRKMLEQQDRMIGEQRKQIERQQESLDNHVKVLNSLQTQLDQMALTQGQQASASEEQIALLDRLQTLEEQLATIPEDPTLARDQEVQPGAILLPGTNASLRIGGYVKVAVINNFDPLASADRFIVGSIPVTDDNEFTFDDSNITSSQSRLNLDLRDSTSLGSFRAFVEGDFAGNGDTFRLRHAYGQFRDILAGKTWSTFYDSLSAPEGLDFEGINGQVVVRQSQVRYFPKVGKNWDLALGLEDPQAQISEIDFDNQIVRDAQGVSDQPDITFSIRNSYQKLSHIRLAGVVREISARSTLSDRTETEFAWGINISGVTQLAILDHRDNMKWQFVYGEGIGRYINDLNTLDGMDGVFDPNGKIQTLPVTAGYIAWQHWWGEALRSTFLFSGVQIDNYSFQPPDSYYKTERLSGNIVYSPVARFDLGGEVIWGRRTNEDGQNGEALQLQVSAKYRF
jgi:hypothetical protein